MKKLFFFVIALVFLGQLSAQEKYYWYNNAKQDLVLDFQRQYITVKSLSDIEMIQKELSLLGIQYDEFQRVVVDSSFSDTLNKYWTFIYPSEPKEYFNPSIIYSSPAYKLIDGTIIGISHLIYVKLKSKDDIIMLESFSKQYGFCILGESNYIPLLYTLSCSVATNFIHSHCSECRHVTATPVSLFRLAWEPRSKRYCQIAGLNHIR